jgi:ABC-type multidrug transport system ATPase subunit
VAARKVLAPLRRLMTGRTTILISHDLHLAHDADEILVVDQGRVVQRGTHAQLTSVEGKYLELWQAQNESVLEVVGEPRPHQQWQPRPQPTVSAADHPAFAGYAASLDPEPALWRPAPAHPPTSARRFGA